MRFKVGETVELANTDGKIGVIIDRIIKTGTNGDNKPWCVIKYLVKPNDAQDFDDYLSCTRKDLKKYVYPTKPEETYYDVTELDDGYKLLLYASIDETDYEYVAAEINDVSYASINKKFTRKLLIGWSVCASEDIPNWSLKRGIKIARHRAFTKPLCVMETPHRHEFDSETIKAILTAKAQWFKENQERFLK